jgi:hypothetical protein|tara:strand:+ start:157 stop:333 length:177 start_codon:yes stop_codon:yes gene_type:complete
MFCNLIDRFTGSSVGVLLLIAAEPDVLESILFDAEAQKLRGRQLVGYTIAEIKSRIPA